MLNLPRPDITIIVGSGDYPAAIVHSSYDNSAEMLTNNPIGTGAYTFESHEVGVKAVLIRKEGHTWWNARNGTYLDRIEIVDYGTDPTAFVAAIEAGEVDMLHQTTGDYVELMDSLGQFEESQVVTASTIVIRTNQDAEVDGMKPYANKNVRRALAMAVDNSVCLELGYAGLGEPAENHHVVKFTQNMQNFRLKKLTQPLPRRCLKQRVWVILNTKSYRSMMIGVKTRPTQSSTAPRRWDLE